jgi:hypothetical protein
VLGIERKECLSKESGDIMFFLFEKCLLEEITTGW